MAVCRPYRAKRAGSRIRNFELSIVIIYSSLEYDGDCTKGKKAHPLATLIPRKDAGAGLDVTVPMCVRSSVCVCVCRMRGEHTTRARTARRRFACACVMRAAVCCRSCWQHYTVPGGTKWFFLALGGIFPHSLFVWRAVCTRRRSATLSVVFFPSLSFRRFPYYLLIFPLSTRFSVGRHLVT